MAAVEEQVFYTNSMNPYISGKSNTVVWSNATVLIVNCMGMMFLYYILEDCLKKILKFMKYTDIHDHKMAKGQYTRQVNLMSTFITGALALTSYQEHGFFHTKSCIAIRSYDIDSQFMLILSFLSYLLYDLVFHRLSVEHYIHHFLGLVAVSSVFLQRSNFGVYFTSACMLIELSTVPMNLVFVTSGLTKDILTGIFALTFFVVRPVFMLMTMYEMFECGIETRTEFYSICAFCGLYVLNLYWFFFLCRKVHQKIFASKKNIIMSKVLKSVQFIKKSRKRE